MIKKKSGNIIGITSVVAFTNELSYILWVGDVILGGLGLLFGALRSTWGAFGQLFATVWRAKGEK